MPLAPAVAIGLAGMRHERLTLSIVIGVDAVGIALGAPLASAEGAALGWRVTFFAAALLALVCAALLAARIPPDARRTDAADRADAGDPAQPVGNRSAHAVQFSAC